MNICVSACGKLTEISITSVTIVICLLSVLLFFKVGNKLLKIIFILIVVLLVYYSLDRSIIDGCAPCGVNSTQFGGFKVLPNWIKFN